MRFPTVFVNHGGGPMPLMGRQPNIANHFREIREKYLADYPKPKAIVIISAHWEQDPIQITSSERPPMYFDYGGFPSETYQYDYPAPGSPVIAKQIHDLLLKMNIENELNSKRGYDHGVFVPLMMIYPEADIPVVCVSLHASLDVTKNLQLGESLQSLRDEDVLIMGSGFTFHNMQAFFNPSERSYKASASFNEWLKDSIIKRSSYENMIEQFKNWKRAPGATIAHPREEHLLPLFVIAAAGGSNCIPKLILNIDTSEEQHAISSYMFE